MIQSSPTRRPKLLHLLIGGVVGIAVLCLADVVAACPTCKDGLANGNSFNMVRGYGYSIIFMMSTPFLILAGLGAYFYLEIRRARKSQQAEPVVPAGDPA